PGRDPITFVEARQETHGACGRNCENWLPRFICHSQYFDVRLNNRSWEWFPSRASVPVIADGSRLFFLAVALPSELLFCLKCPARRRAMVAPSGSETILLVDDEKMVRAVMSRSLRLCGYTVLDAGNG